MQLHVLLRKRTRGNVLLAEVARESLIASNKGIESPCTRKRPNVALRQNQKLQPSSFYQLGAVAADHAQCWRSLCCGCDAHRACGHHCFVSAPDDSPADAASLGHSFSMQFMSSFRSSNALFRVPVPSQLPGACRSIPVCAYVAANLLLALAILPWIGGF